MSVLLFPLGAVFVGAWSAAVVFGWRAAGERRFRRAEEESLSLIGDFDGTR